MERVTEENRKNKKGRGGESEKMLKGERRRMTLKKAENPGKKRKRDYSICYTNKLLKYYI